MHRRTAIGVSAAVPLVLAIVIFAVAPGFSIILPILAVPLAALGATSLTLLLRRLDAWPSSAATIRVARLRVGAILTAAWLIALLLAPLVVILGSPLLLWALSAVVDVSTTASSEPAFQTYLPLLGYSSPLVVAGWLAALLVIPRVLTTEESAPG